MKHQLKPYLKNLSDGTTPVTWWYWAMPTDISNSSLKQYRTALIFECRPHLYKLQGYEEGKYAPFEIQSHKLTENEIYTIYNDIAYKTHNESLINLKLEDVKHFKYLKRKHGIKHPYYIFDNATVKKATTFDSEIYDTSDEMNFITYSLKELYSLWSE